MNRAGHAERYEAVGDLYYRQTGYLRPGKSEPLESTRDSNSEENVERFEQWFATRAWSAAIDRIVQLENELQKAQAACDEWEINGNKALEIIDELRTRDRKNRAALLRYMASACENCPNCRSPIDERLEEAWKRTGYRWTERKRRQYGQIWLPANNFYTRATRLLKQWAEALEAGRLG